MSEQTERAELRNEKRESKPVEDTHEAGLHQQRPTTTFDKETSSETSLISEVSEDVAPAVEEFMEQAAQQNEAAAEEIPDVKNRPGSYISFEDVSKAFGD